MQRVEVGYVTDIEGNLEYFNRWVQLSGVLRRGEGTDELELAHEGAYFVYGGDVMDRFDGSLRLTHLLVSLKKRYPSRVFLLAGNRDLNKVRLTAELSSEEMARPYDSIPRPHWDPKAPTLAEYLTELAETRGNGCRASDLDSRAERLRYYLVHTLGCPDGFELRRRELGILRGKSESLPSDEDVVASMLNDVAPDGGNPGPGILREYLELASIVCILGNTVFVHGSLDRTSIQVVPEDSARFYLPPAPQPFRTVPGGLVEWAAEMNDLLRRGLAAHEESPLWDEGRTRRGGEVLVALQNLSALSGRSVVSGSYANGGNITSAAAAKSRRGLEQRMEEDRGRGRHSALLFQEGWATDPRDETVAAWLLAAGVRRVVVGHKPSGDSPAVLSAQYTGVEIISADTCYADTAAPDRRGKSVAGVTIAGPSLHCNAATVFGVLRDGREHRATLAELDAKGGERGGDALVGRELAEGWWCKARLCSAEGEGGQGERETQEKEAVYWCCRGQGRVVEYREERLPADPSGDRL